MAIFDSRKILGTQNVIDVSIDNNVKKIVFRSSDKAVNHPIQWMRQSFW